MTVEQLIAELLKHDQKALVLLETNINGYEFFHTVGEIEIGYRSSVQPEGVSYVDFDGSNVVDEPNAICLWPALEPHP